jgi:hypothetical protein
MFRTYNPKEACDLPHLFSPPLSLPRQGKRFISLPWREGLREGQKMAHSFLFIKDAFCYSYRSIFVMLASKGPNTALETSSKA